MKENKYVLKEPSITDTFFRQEYTLLEEKQTGVFSIELDKLCYLDYLRELVNSVTSPRVSTSIKNCIFDAMREAIHNALEHTAYKDHKPKPFDTEKVKFTKQAKTGLYRMKAIEESNQQTSMGPKFYLDQKLIKKNTLGGLVAYPWMITDSWVESDVVIEGPTLLTGSYLSTAFKNRNQSWNVVMGSNLDDVYISESVLTNSRIKDSTINDSLLDTSNLSVVGVNKLLAINERLNSVEFYLTPEAGNYICATNCRMKCIPVFTGVGSENGTLIAFRLLDGRVVLNRGCFHGTLEEFKDSLLQNKYRHFEETEMYYQAARYAEFLVRSRVGKASLEHAEKLKARRERVASIMNLMQTLFDHSHKAWDYYNVRDVIKNIVAPRLDMLNNTICLDDDGVPF
nr:MAG TPA: hypothetical protein [Caudoviricetes sp.]